MRLNRQVLLHDKVKQVTTTLNLCSIGKCVFLEWENNYYQYTFDTFFNTGGPVMQAILHDVQWFFSTIFRQFQANNCRNSELEENFG